MSMTLPSVASTTGMRMHWSFVNFCTTGPPSELSAGPRHGRDWFTVLSGTAVLRLGDRTLLVAEVEAAEFSLMTPHVVGAHAGPVEILTVLDNAGEHSHLDHV